MAMFHRTVSRPKCTDAHQYSVMVVSSASLPVRSSHIEPPPRNAAAAERNLLFLTWSITKRRNAEPWCLNRVEPRDMRSNDKTASPGSACEA